MTEARVRVTPRSLHLPEADEQPSHRAKNCQTPPALALDSPGTRQSVDARSTPASVANALADLEASCGFATILGRLIEMATNNSPVRAADAPTWAEKKFDHCARL